MTVKTSQSSKSSIFELDLLRVIGISLVLYSHSKNYLGWSPRFSWFIQHPGTVGLGIFFCLSGFLMQRSREKQGANFDSLSFLKRRFIRILPLYWIAIIVFVIEFHYFGIFHNLSFAPIIPTIVTHFSASQLFFVPKVSEIMTLWYIGALIPYYVLFSWTSRFRFKTYLNLNLLLLAIAFAFKLMLEASSITLVDSRILLHYPTFLLGVFVAHVDANLIWVKAKSGWMTLIFGLAAIAYIPIVGRDNINLWNSLRLAKNSILYYGYCVIWSLFIITLVCWLIKQCRVNKSLISPTTSLSQKSYAIYLFHRPIYGVIYGLLISLDLDSIPIRTLLFPIATLVLIIASHYITIFDINVLKPKANQIVRHIFFKQEIRD